MGNIEDIIKAIDDELIRIDKEYLLLGNANQLLANQGLISISEKFDKTLKKALEENKIPHAYQSENAPKQWRIPLSSEGLERKKLMPSSAKTYTEKEGQPNDGTFKIKLRVTNCPFCSNSTNVPDAYLNNEFINCLNCKSDFPNPFKQNKANINKNSLLQTDNVICPACKLRLFIPKEIVNEKYIQCLTCGENFRNPLIIQNDNNNPVSFNITKTQRNWIIAIIVLIAVVIFGNLPDSDSTSTLYYINHITYAAVSKESYDSMMECASANDDQALGVLILNGQIELLDLGAEVYLVDSHFGYAVVRRQGSPQKLWLVSHAITKK